LHYDVRTADIMMSAYRTPGWSCGHRRCASPCHATATKFRHFNACAEHREHALIRVIDLARFCADDFRQLAMMRLRHVDVEHRLVDPLVTEPRL